MPETAPSFERLSVFRTEGENFPSDETSYLTPATAAPTPVFGGYVISEFTAHIGGFVTTGTVGSVPFKM